MQVKCVTAYHFRDGRGVNRFAGVPAVASFGIPYPNIGELAAEYQVLTGVVPDISVEESPLREENLAVAKFPDIDFQEFVDGLVSAEILQEVGRLRSHLRPKEKLIYYFVGDFDVGFLQEELPGCKFQRVRAIEIDWRAAPCCEQTKFTLIKAIGKQILSGNEKPTQQDVVDGIAAVLPKEKVIKQPRVSQIAAGIIIGGWAKLLGAVASILASLLESNSIPDVDDDQAWVALVYLPLVAQGTQLLPVVNLVQTASTVGNCFFVILQHVAFNVRKALLLPQRQSQLLERAFSIMAHIITGMAWIIEQFTSLLDSS